MWGPHILVKIDSNIVIITKKWGVIKFFKYYNNISNILLIFFFFQFLYLN